MSQDQSETLPLLKTTHQPFADAIAQLCATHGVACRVRAEQGRVDVSGTGPDEDRMWHTITTYYVDVDSSVRNSLREARRQAVAAHPPVDSATNAEADARRAVQIQAQIDAMHRAIQSR